MREFGTYLDGTQDDQVRTVFGTCESPWSRLLYGDGTGGIRSVTSFPSNSSTMQIADINHDGIPDLLSTGGPLVLLGHADGTYTSVTTTTHVSGDDYPAGCDYGDEDGDGNLDAVCEVVETSTGDIKGHTDPIVLHGNGDGSFNPTPITDVQIGNGDGEYDGLASFDGVVTLADRMAMVYLT